MIEEACPTCHAAVRSTREGASVVLRCETCGWNAVATAVEPWMVDDARYHVIVTSPDVPDGSVLIALARLSGRNALEIRRGLREGRLVVATGHTEEVEPVRARLEELGVDVTLERVVRARNRSRLGLGSGSDPDSGSD